MTYTNPFAPDPQNPFTHHATAELEVRMGQPATNTPVSEVLTVIERAHQITEELSRREDLSKAVELWERLCAVPFVRGETQGYYTHSTRDLSPEGPHGGMSNTHRMPDAAEIEALVLSDGEETAYPPHDAQPEYDPRDPDLTPEQRAATYFHEDRNPWSGDDRLYPITVTLISCGDYHGSDVDAANNRVLKDAPGVDFHEPNTGGQGSVFNVTTVTVGEMTSFENATDPGDTDRDPAERRADCLQWLEDLVTTLESLVDNVIYLDEEKHSEYLAELAREAWESWLESDVHSELTKIGPGGVGAWVDLIDDMGPELKANIRTTYFGYEENEWNAESATSVVNGRHSDAVKHVARTVFGWNVP